MPATTRRCKRTFVVAATGPSLSLGQVRDVAIARQSHPDLSVITVNDAVYPMWWADVAYACDAAWWVHHRGLPGFQGLKMRLENPGPDGADQNRAPFTDIKTVLATGTDGIDLRRGQVRTGCNSGYQAVQIAAHFGAERIILLGFDCNEPTPKHWFGEHPREIRKKPLVAAWIQRFGQMAEAMSIAGIEVVNASPGTALRRFELADLTAALARR